MNQFIENQDKFRSCLKDFNNVCYEKYQTYAYSAGYFESMLQGMFAELSLEKQQHWIERMETALSNKKDLSRAQA